jgi:hypothetical protein
MERRTDSVNMYLEGSWNNTGRIIRQSYTQLKEKTMAELRGSKTGQNLRASFAGETTTSP